MNSKILKLTNKIIAMTIVVLILSTSVVSAVSTNEPTQGSNMVISQNIGEKIKEALGKIFNYSNNGSTDNNNETTTPENTPTQGMTPTITAQSLAERLKSALGKIFNSTGNMNGGTNGSYEIPNLKIDLEKLKEMGKIDFAKIEELIAKLSDPALKDKLLGITEKFPNLSGGTGSGGLNLNLDTSGLTDILLGILGGNNSLAITPNTVEITSDTVYRFTQDEKYKVTLKAKIYENNLESGKWVVLIHPFLLNGEFIANSIAPFYLEKGYNVIAPDLRGFGDSEGSVALGFLESLDIYDWLDYLDKRDYKVDQVMIHGVSLGAATTNFVSGIDKFIPELGLKSLEQLHVIGLVEDCGYTDMTQFGGKSMLLGLGIGLTDANFETYSNAEKSLMHCKLPMFIIHGTSDTTVKPANAEAVATTVQGPVKKWDVQGGMHAFIIMGSKKDEYKKNVQQYIADCESGAVNSYPKYEPSTSTTPGIGTNAMAAIQKLLEGLKGIFNR